MGKGKLSMEPEWQRKHAIEMFNYTWTLIDKTGRSPEEDDLMIHAAHTSRFLWDSIGEPVNHARGEWQVARVYAVVGRAEPALHHAQRCLEICEANGIGDFDLAFAYEALARASAVAGDPVEMERFRNLALQAAENIAETDDREHFDEQLASISPAD